MMPTLLHHRFVALSVLVATLLLVRTANASVSVECEYEDDAKTAVKCDGQVFEVEQLDEPGSTAFYTDIGIVLFLTIMAGLMSGLTMGLLSIDLMNLTIIANGGSEEDKYHANRILPLVKRHHLLLVTLLLGNASAMEALPLFLDKMVPQALAIVFSVTLVLFFGEIIPQAICTRYGLKIGSYLSWFVWGVIILVFPIAWPVSKLLDWVLGHEHGTFFRRSELKELVSMHGVGSNPGGLTEDEVAIIKGALDLMEKDVASAMTPRKDVFTVDHDDYLTQDLLKKVILTGHSRIPVTKDNNPDHIVGLMLVKSVLHHLHWPTKQTKDPKVKDMALRNLPFVEGSTKMYDMLNEFQTGKSHMAAVTSDGQYIGIITLEDVIEELIQEEIYDETDTQPGQALPAALPVTRIAQAFLRRASTVTGNDNILSSYHTGDRRLKPRGDDDGPTAGGGPNRLVRTQSLVDGGRRFSSSDDSHKLFKAQSARNVRSAAAFVSPNSGPDSATVSRAMYPGLHNSGYHAMFRSNSDIENEAWFGSYGSFKSQPVSQTPTQTVVEEGESDEERGGGGSGGGGSPAAVVRTRAGSGGSGGSGGYRRTPTAGSERNTTKTPLLQDYEESEVP